VTVAESLALPHDVVAVTVYVVVEPGVTVICAVVAPPGDQLYVVFACAAAPSVTVWPVQID
jgi:hypothetical protein